MAIAFRAVGTWSFGFNDVTPVIPTAQVTGDMMLLIASGKPFDLGWSVGTAGWVSLGSAASGSTAAGVDTGSMKLEVWYKVATVDTETNPTITEGSPAFNVIGGLVHVFSKGASETWDTPAITFGADETNGTSISVTFGADPGGVGGDYVVLTTGINTDAMGPLTVALVPTWTGITFGAADGARQGESTSGGDMAAYAISYPVSSGTSSAAPSCTGTGTASGGADKLEAAFIRLRVSAASASNPGWYASSSGGWW